MKENLSAFEKGYIAAFLDGEGSIYANRMNRGSGNKHMQTYYGVCIHNKNKEVLKWIQHRVGGNIYERKDNGVSQLQFVKLVDIYRFLSIVTPYLIVKKKLARFMLDYVTSRINHIEDSNNKSCPLSDDEIELIARIKHLNEIGECYN